MKRVMQRSQMMIIVSGRMMAIVVMTATNIVN